MPAAIQSFDEKRLRSIDAPFVCHFRQYDPAQQKRVFAARTAKVSTGVIRPLLELALNRAADRQYARPIWTRSLEAQRIPLERAGRWIEEVSSTLREPALGLSALTKLERGAGDLPELAAECAQTLGDALSVLTRYVSILNEAASFHLHVQGETAIFTMQYRSLPSRVLRDFFAGFVALAVRRWLGVPTDLALHFAGPRPAYGHAYRSALPDMSIGFAAPCDALVLSASTLRLPLLLADAKRHAFLLGITNRVQPFPESRVWPGKATPGAR